MVKRVWTRGYLRPEPQRLNGVTEDHRLRAQLAARAAVGIEVCGGWSPPLECSGHRADTRRRIMNNESVK